MADVECVQKISIHFVGALQNMETNKQHCYQSLLNKGEIIDFNEDFGDGSSKLEVDTAG